MARPLSASDDQILDIAYDVLRRRGADGFTVSEVAREIGLSRAAITLRFKSGEELKRILLQRQIKQFKVHIDALTIRRGGAGLLAIAEMIGGMIGGRDRFSHFMMRYLPANTDSELFRMEEQRGKLLRDAVGAAMPETAIGKAAAIDAFMAHITGTLLYWQLSEGADVKAFLRKRTLNWLKLSRIPVVEDAA
jgi:AcrR family transcriptional regulator